MYDTLIIGGGISGLYCALHLKNVLLLEQNDYWGGRIKTHTNPHYEIGAGRFRKTHTRLWKLIQHYQLTPVPIPGRLDYRDKEQGLVPHVEKYLQSQLKKMKLHERLRTMTFYDYCVEALGKEDANHFVEASGYAELYYKNAYDELQSFQKDYVQGDYFVLKEGLGELCRRMAKDIPGKGILRHRVKRIERKDDHFIVDGYTAKRIIVTLPPSLFKQFPLLSPYDKVVSNLKNGPLLRIYAKYPTSWTDTLHKVTTRHIPRHIIPIRDGIVMIVYVEDQDVVPFLRNGKLKSIQEIKTIISQALSLVFTEKVPEPEWVRPYLWEIGTHAWLPGPSSTLLKQMPILEGISVCGEAFSTQQAWVEGALESTDSLIEKVDTTKTFVSIASFSSVHQTF
jgi:monoamine oxidase